MRDSKQLFSTKAEVYAQARPSYPDEMVEFLVKEAGLGAESLVADIGGGTGLSARPFLERGIPVVLVEPNLEMRSVAESFLSGFESVRFYSGSGETTGLEDASTDLVFCGQSFHWMDMELARAEFRRILKAGGFAALAWNLRQHEDAVQKAFDCISEEFGGESYERIRHDNLAPDYSSFFEIRNYREVHFENEQVLDLLALSNLIYSRSYIPDRDTENGEQVQQRINQLFQENEQEGTVLFRYTTKVYVGTV